MRNVFKYTSLYTPSAQPIFVEEDLFRTPPKVAAKLIIPLVSSTTKVGSEKSSEIGSEKGSEIGSEIASAKSPKVPFLLGSEKDDGSEKSSENILEIMIKNPTVTISELADTIGISTRAVEKQIAKLKDAGSLKRVGPDHGGHWKVKRK